MAIGIGCRRNDPPPTHFEDLGDESELLLPTSSTWSDAEIAQGQAQWRPFREPRDPDEVAEDAEDEASGEGGTGEVEQALRELVAEYNAMLADGALDELPDFFVTDQADGAKEVADALTALATRLGAAAQHMPAEAENLAKLSSHLVPTAALVIEIGAITVKGEGEAVAALARVPSLSFLPGMPPATDIPREVRFTVGEDDYWYIESPVVPPLRQALPFLTQSSGVLDTFMAAAGSGGPTPENLQPVVDQLKPAIDAMNAPGTGTEAAPQPATAEPEAAGTAAPDGP
jgi:hypothetical protein